MANYFYLINENKSIGKYYIKNVRWWFGGDCFAEVLGKNSRCPLQKGEKGLYNDFYDMGYEKYALTQEECQEIGKLLEEKIERIEETCQKGINTDPYFAHLVKRSKTVAKELQKATKDDKFIAYWQ